MVDGVHLADLASEEPAFQQEVLHEVIHAQQGLGHGAALPASASTQATLCPGETSRSAGCSLTQMALAKRQRPAPIDLPATRAEFAALLKSVWEPAQGWA